MTKKNYNSYLFTGNKKTCTGCGACEQICPLKAINMKEDKEGFLFPIIDKNICIECGLCDKKCPVNNSQSNTEENHKAYLATALEKNYTLSSATIGICSMVAEYVLNKNGYVYGVILDEKEWRSKHICITTKERIESFRNSKYIQSDTNKTFSEVKNLLKSGHYVLYTGTPCQIAGLKSFLKKDYENLITIDIICHGVYSYKLLQQEINYWEEKYLGKISNFKFRSKLKYDWNYGGVINFDIIDAKRKSKHIEVHGSCSPTYRCYAYSGDKISYNLRECCYSCFFRSKNRYGDITVGDAWGMRNNHSNLFTMENCKYGISLLLTNNNKGNIIINTLKNRINLFSIKHEDAFKQEALLPINRNIPIERYKIYENIGNENYNDLIERILQVNFHQLQKRHNFIFYKNKFKNIIKHILLRK